MTSQRILDAALSSFAGRGYEATSLDAMAKALEITKQSILYWFPSKDALLEAVIAQSAQDLSEALESALAGAGQGWVRVEAVVRSVFRLAARQPELLGLLREVGRLGPPAATQMTLAWSPWCSVPPHSSKPRWMPAPCAGTILGCSCWPSTRR